MTAFRTAAPFRPAALALSFVVTFAMLASVNALSRQEYREAVTAQAAAASVAQAAAPVAARA